MGTSIGLVLAYGLILRPDTLPDVDDDDDTTLGKMIRDGDSHDGIRILAHGTEGEEGHMVVIAGTVKRAAIPHAIELTSRRLGQVTEHDVKLKLFARKYKLKTKGEPGWLVAATAD